MNRFRLWNDLLSSTRRFFLNGLNGLALVLALAALQFCGASARAQFTNYAVIHSFGGDGRAPYTGLLEGSDGALYGTTRANANVVAGTLFRLSKDGSSYAVLHQFADYVTDGYFPNALIEGSDGRLYGTTRNDWFQNGGTLFQLKKDGSGYRVVHLFGFSGEGYWPRGPLAEGKDGRLYGTTQYGGSADQGTVFKVNKDGSAYSTLHSFSVSEGHNPRISLIEGTDGVLYGTTSYGGNWKYGTLYKINENGSGYAVLFSFPEFQGNYPDTLLEGTDGALYGTTYQWLFRIGKDGTGYTNLHEFMGANKWDESVANVVEGSDGVLYGTTSKGGSGNQGTVFKLNKDGSGHAVLHSFSGIGSDGTTPFAKLLEGSEGLLYGTTSKGGITDFGTVFAIARPDALPVFLLQPRSSTNVEGTPASLSVIGLSHMSASYQWYFNDAPLPNATNHTLSFSSVALSNAGPYYVVGTNASGSVTSAVATLTVTSAPLVVYGPVLEGARFYARFAGSPGKTYTIEHATSLSPPDWQAKTNVTAPVLDEGWGTGVFEFRDTVAVGGQRYYRTVQPPN